MCFARCLSRPVYVKSITALSTNESSNKMPRSMRKQRRDEFHRRERDADGKKARKLAAARLRENKTLSLRHLSEITGVTRSTIHEIKQTLELKDDNALRCIISPKKRTGAQRVLTDEEEGMIVTHLLWSARRGFAADNVELKALMAKIANDGRKRGFKSGVPSCDAIRSFRERHPELRYRTSESKETVKLKGECFDHVRTYVDVLKEVGSDYPSISDHGDLLWNMDETHVDGEFGKRKKVYSPADTHHGGFIASNKNGGDGRHVTVVIAVSASDKKAPPFFIVQGKRNMSNWYLKLDEKEYNLHNGHLNVLTQDEWFPSDACVVLADNGSMEQRIIPLFIDHLNRYVRKFVSHDKHYTLVLDGHSSRKGIEWLEIALEKNCVVVQSPANTSHFLQPCDQQVNKTFATTVRAVRDALVIASNRKMDHRNIQIKLMLGAMAFEAISPEDIRVSWITTGLWPMDFKFAERWRTRTDDIKEENNQLVCELDRSGPSTALAAVQKRKTDKETFNILATIVDDARNGGIPGVSNALRAFSRCLEKRETVHSILATRSRVDSRTTGSKVSNHNPVQVEKSKNTALPAGAPAEYLTHGDVIRKRREELAVKQAEEDAKAKKRKKQAEQRLLREEQKQERARIKAEGREKRRRETELKAGKQQKRKRQKTVQATSGPAMDVGGTLMSSGVDENAIGVRMSPQQ